MLLIMIVTGSGWSLFTAATQGCDQAEFIDALGFRESEPRAQTGGNQGIEIQHHSWASPKNSARSIWTTGSPNYLAQTIDPEGLAVSTAG